ncbi:MAG TPA: hypothetical protein EYH07_18805 [Kiloniellaceae bacterium]|nr:hypothetical protein [Kiloniellaceae bacterium]
MAAQQSPPPGPVAEIPIAATVMASFAAVFGRLALVAQAAKGAVALLIGAWIISLVLPAGGGVSFFLILVSFAATCHFGVNWCRIILFGPEALPAKSLSWGEIHWRFFGYSAFLALTMMLMAVPLTFIGSVLAAVFGLMGSAGQIGPGVILVLLVMFAGMIYALARLGFVLPAAAAGETYGLGLSWQHTAGQGLRLTAALAAVALPLTIAQIAISLILLQLFFGLSMADLMPTVPLPGEELPAEGPAPAVSPSEPPSILGVIVFNLIQAVANFLAFAVVFTLLSFAFRTCTGWVPGPGAPGGTSSGSAEPPRLPREDDAGFGDGSDGRPDR